MNMPAFAIAFARDVIPTRPEQAAMWFVDIRNFRSINPKFGYSKGNEILKCMAEAIRETLAHDNPVVRVGADRFAFITVGLDFDRAQEGLQQLSKYVGEMVSSIGVNTRLTLKGGIHYLDDADYRLGRHSRAMDFASIAHRKARREKGNALSLFTKEDLERDNRRIAIEQSFDKALAEGQIEVWFQPQVDYIFGEVIGAEALARWNHPELGWMEPSEFVPALENIGKVHELDLLVWEEACRNAGRWRNASDGKPVPISVNVSRAEMLEDGLVERFLALLKKYDLPEGSIHLEITESAFANDMDQLTRIIETMRNNNVLVEMDDFGSGLSSLSMLKDVPVDVVKLDIGFMRSAISEDRGGVVLSSIIRMLQGLDTPIIAEGVETREQAEMLKNMGCHLMQGFHFSRPMPVDEFEDYLASNSTVDNNERRMRGLSRIEELTSIDPSSSYLFNEAMGPTLFFYVAEGITESILVNDEFYEACGLDRVMFRDKKINPIEEIDPASRGTFWRAATEALDCGAAFCRGKVQLSGRWIDCVIRYLGTNARGDAFSLNVVRSGELEGERGNVSEQEGGDNAWAFALLDRIMPCGFAKCKIDDILTIEYSSPNFVDISGLQRDEFSRRYHNSFAGYIVASDRDDVLRAVNDAVQTGELIDCSFNVNYGYGEQRRVQMYGRVVRGDEGVPYVYVVVLAKDDEIESISADGESGLERVIPFELFFDEDKLVIYADKADGSKGEYVFEHWLQGLADYPNGIAQASASKILASIHDLRHHPSSGFTDLRCDLRGDRGMRWYHINFTCEADEEGITRVIHGYAQDANDQMGSVKWWRRQAEIDQLTGLLNRNAVLQEVNHSMRMHGAGMMFMIDLDSFKRINDELGHLTGDALLRDVAEALGERFREGDVLGRYGGDEFVAFVPLSSGDLHAIAAQRGSEIIESISSIEISDGSNAACSVGVAVSRNREATFYDLLEVADEALYKSKLGGKGRYTVLDMDMEQLPLE